MADYIEYLEQFLGETAYGWSKDAGGSDLPFQIVKYNGGPFPGTVSYTTLGLSNIPLQSPVSDKKIRHELVFVADSQFGDRNIPGILQQVANQAIQRNTAYVRGNVIGPYGVLFEGSELEALYVSIPVYFPDVFHVFDDAENGPIVQVWLLPITRREVLFVQENGWDAFEDVLERINPDLVDFARGSVV